MPLPCFFPVRSTDLIKSVSEGPPPFPPLVFDFNSELDPIKNKRGILTLFRWLSFFTRFRRVGLFGRSVVFDLGLVLALVKRTNSLVSSLKSSSLLVASWVPPRLPVMPAITSPMLLGLPPVPLPLAVPPAAVAAPNKSLTAPVTAAATASTAALVLLLLPPAVSVLPT